MTPPATNLDLFYHVFYLGGFFVSLHQVIENALVFGFIGLLPILSGAFAPTSVMIMTGVSIYKLYNRGAGRGPSNDMEMYQKTFKMKPFALTVAACLLSMGIGALLSQVWGASAQLLHANSYIPTTSCTPPLYTPPRTYTTSFIYNLLHTTPGARGYHRHR